MNDIEVKIQELNNKYMHCIEKFIKENAHSIIKIECADNESDTKKATDYKIQVIGGDVACRIRFDFETMKNNKKIYRDFTIRTRSKNGGKTEIDKIKEGFADWYIYIWERIDDDYDYIFVDLNIVRESGILEVKRNQISNNDGTYFIAIPLKEIRPAIINKNFDNELYKDYKKYVEAWDYFNDFPFTLT